MRKSWRRSSGCKISIAKYSTRSIKGLRCSNSKRPIHITIQSCLSTSRARSLARLLGSHIHHIIIQGSSHLAIPMVICSRASKSRREIHLRPANLTWSQGSWVTLSSERVAHIILKDQIGSSLRPSPSTSISHPLTVALTTPLPSLLTKLNAQASPTSSPITQLPSTPTPKASSAPPATRKTSTISKN